MNKTEHNNDIFSKVLTIGPAQNCKGGIASVLKIYKQYLPGFKQLSTNSPRGTIIGSLVAACSLLRMPIERLCGRSILHVHVASGKSYVRKSVFISWGKILGFKIIYHCHSGLVGDYFRLRGLHKIKRIIDKADVIVALSDKWKNYFKTTFNHPYVETISNPHIPVKQISRPKEKHPLKLLFLGLICDAKGIFDLIDVMAANKKRWEGRVKLTIGGSGETKRLLETIRNSQLESIVEYAGWIEDEDKDALFAKNDVLILPTYFEGLPMAIIEAMGHGMPSISTPVGGIPEMITHCENGILFNPGDKNAMSAAIDCYLLNPDLIERHGNAALKIVPKFYPEKIKSDLKNIYLSLS